MEILGADLEFVGRPEIDPERGAPTPAILVAVGDIAIFGRIIVGGDGRGVATPVGKGPVAAIVAAQHLDVVVRDRKSVVSGKSVSVRGDLGGRRVITKKQLTTKQRSSN